RGGCIGWGGHSDGAIQVTSNVVVEVARRGRRNRDDGGGSLFLRANDLSDAFNPLFYIPQPRDKTLE
ncbi:unnamed protein product, partial [Dovyalis caffra]